MLIIAIDGACRRNGKPDCVSAGGVYIEQYMQVDDHTILSQTSVLSNYEIQSTNQRGELLALLTALDYIWSARQETRIITDSEYIFNAMTKEWYIGWESRDWKTATGTPVKNSDLWREIKHAYEKCRSADIDVIFYHIKGHCIPFGKVTANSLLASDTTGKALYLEVLRKYDSVAKTTRVDTLEEANKLSIKNNGFALDDQTLRNFVAMNTMADAIATKCVDAADSLMDHAATNGS